MKTTPIGSVLHELEAHLVAMRQAEASYKSANDELAALQREFAEEVSPLNPATFATDDALLIQYRRKLMRKAGVRDAINACSVTGKNLSSMRLMGCKLDTKIHRAYGFDCLTDVFTRAGLCSSGVWWNRSEDCAALLQHLPGIRAPATT